MSAQTKPRRLPISDWLLPAGLIAILLALWQLAVAVGNLPAAILPGPIDVVVKMVESAPMFLTQAVPTVIAIFVGFGLAVLVALPLAVVMIYSEILRKAVYPLLIFSQVIPKVAIAPLFIIWFGFGQSPKILMVLLMSFFPIVINAMVGLSQARPQSLMLVRSMGATRWQAFWKVRWPWALPAIFAGAKVAITLAVVGAVVAEFVGSDNGLGKLLMEARGNFDGTTVFASIGWLAIIGSCLFLVVQMLERLLVPGPRHSRRFEASGEL